MCAVRNTYEHFYILAKCTIMEIMLNFNERIKRRQHRQSNGSTSLAKQQQQKIAVHHRVIVETNQGLY